MDEESSLTAPPLLTSPSTANMLVDTCESRLTVHLSCDQLRNMDFIGKSDPFAILFLDNTGATTRPPLPSQAMKQPPPSGVPSTTTSTLVAQASLNDDAPGFPVGFRASVQPSSGGYSGRDYRWQRIGQTETIRNSLHPVFVTSFEIPYFFERAQRLAIDVFDRDAFDARDDQLHLHDYLGSAEVALPAVVRAKGQRLPVRLYLPDRPNAKCGFVTIAVEEVSEQKQRISYDVALQNLPIRRGAGPFITVKRKSAAAYGPNNASGTNNNPTLESTPTSASSPNAPVSRAATPTKRSKSSPAPSQKLTKHKGARDNLNKDEWITVYRSRPAKQDTRSSGKGNFLLSGFSHNYEKLCRCDDDLLLQFEVSFERHGTHQVVASGTSSLAEAESNHGEILLETRSNSCFGPSKTPSIHLNKRSITEDITFLDYIIGGCEISLVIAIDFSASNGDPSKKGTLHFCDSMEPNEYETAIRSVGDILASYDTDQLFPVFGYGAKLPPDYSAPSNLFSLTEDLIVPGAIQSQDQFCYTIDGVLNAYRHALYNVRLSGPTAFAGIVQAAADHARRESRGNEQSYTILLILTDGVINDLDETLNAIFQASSLPISIVIIGIGGADFTDMNFLDGDGLGRERDIVQFVNYRQFSHAYEVLRSRVLEEIPTQFLDYMNKRNIKPLPVPDDD